MYVEPKALDKCQGKGRRKEIKVDHQLLYIYVCALSFSISSILT